MITLSCFSRPETFANQLTYKTNPYPSNDPKRKTIDELIEIAKRKRAKETSLLFQTTSSKKETAVKIPKPIKVFKREPQGKELRDVVELTELCVDKNVEVDQEVLKNAIVYDPFPKYMVDVTEEYKEDIEKEITTNQQELAMRKFNASDTNSDFNQQPVAVPFTALNERSPTVTPRGEGDD